MSARRIHKGELKGYFFGTPQAPRWKTCFWGLFVTAQAFGIALPNV
jgi:hypothetical protein